MLLDIRSVGEGALNRSLGDLDPDAPAASVDLLRASCEELGLVFGPSAVRDTASMDERIVDVISF